MIQGLLMPLPRPLQTTRAMVDVIQGVKVCVVVCDLRWHVRRVSHPLSLFLINTATSPPAVVALQLLVVVSGRALVYRTVQRVSWYCFTAPTEFVPLIQSVCCSYRNRFSYFLGPVPFVHSQGRKLIRSPHLLNGRILLRRQLCLVVSSAAGC